MYEELNFEEFIRRYCGRQEQTPEGLSAILAKQKRVYDPDGWMLLECQVMDSSRLGEYVILPFGPNNTFKEVPDHFISPRGLASDISAVVAVLRNKRCEHEFRHTGEVPCAGPQKCVLCGESRPE